MRLRLHLPITGWNDQRALVLTDTPRPDCPDCRGEGGHGHTSVTAEGEFDGIEWDPCPCWNGARRWTLLRLPRIPSRHQPGRDSRDANGYSDEPPF